MSCLPELTYFIYVDGECSLEEARRVEAHLTACPRCRALVDGLRAENVFLTEALLEVDEAALPAPRGFRLLDLAWTTAVVLVVAGSAQVAYDWVTGVETPAGTSWLNPFNLGVQVQLFFASLFYLLSEGASMLASLTTTVSALLLAVGFIAGAALLWRRRQTPRFMLVTFSLLVALGLAQPAAAVEHRAQKKGSIVIRADEVVDDTLVIHADNVTVDGTVTGNLIVFCGDLSMNGTVKGDLLVFTGNARIKGTVDGNVFAFAGNTEISGRVGQSVHAFTGNFLLPQGAEVGGDAFGFAGTVTQEGEIKRDLMAFSGATIVSGAVGRNVRAFTKALTVRSSARIGGDLKARVERQDKLSIDPAATIGGKTDITFLPARTSPWLTPRFYIQKALGLAIVFLLGLLMYWLFPVLRTARVAGGSELGKQIGVGVVALVVPPVVACVLFILLIGIGILAKAFVIATLIPLLITVLWLLTVYMSKVVVGLAIGQALSKSPPGAPSGIALPLLLGLVVIYVFISLPIVGPVLNLGVWLVGLGIGVLHVWRHRRAPAPPPLPA